MILRVEGETIFIRILFGAKAFDYTYHTVQYVNEILIHYRILLIEKTILRVDGETIFIRIFIRCKKLMSSLAK